MKGKEVIYKDKSYLIEKNYEDWFCMGAQINQVYSTISLVVDSMLRELKALDEILKVDSYTQHFKDMTETLYLCNDKLYDLSECCQANEEKEYKK